MLISSEQNLKYFHKLTTQMDNRWDEFYLTLKKKKCIHIAVLLHICDFVVGGGSLTPSPRIEHTYLHTYIHTTAAKDHLCNRTR